MNAKEMQEQVEAKEFDYCSAEEAESILESVNDPKRSYSSLIMNFVFILVFVVGGVILFCICKEFYIKSRGSLLSKEVEEEFQLGNLSVGLTEYGANLYKLDTEECDEIKMQSIKPIDTSDEISEPEWEDKLCSDYMDILVLCDGDKNINNMVAMVLSPTGNLTDGKNSEVWGAYAYVKFLRNGLGGDLITSNFDSFRSPKPFDKVRYSKDINKVSYMSWDVNVDLANQYYFRYNIYGDDFTQYCIVVKDGYDLDEIFANIYRTETRNGSLETFMQYWAMEDLFGDWFDVEAKHALAKNSSLELRSE